MNCPACHSPIPVGSRFCNACGAALGALPTGAPQPEPSPAYGERRQVTVLFSDLSGYTALTERLDAEEVREVMARVFGEASRIITGYGGVVEKYIGDAVMAVFGLNRAHEDDGVRAVRAAREIGQAVQKIAAPLSVRLGREIGMHTGINTGLVVTGQTGDAAGAMGIVGDAVNVASRLSDLARNGEILLGGATAALVERFFELTPLPPTEVKGKSEAVQVFRVGEARERPAATHRFAGVRAQLTGRDVELAQLRQAYQHLRDRRGAIIALRAEAGTGKSRLVEEFRAALPAGEHQWFSGAAYDHTRGIPYAPVLDLLSGAWGLHEGDSPAQMRGKIEAGAGAVLGDPAPHIPFLGALFALEYPEVAQASPEYRKGKMQEALLAVFEGMARARPTVFHLEDLHWADPSTVELLRQVLTRFTVPAITVATYRPPFHLFPEDATARGYREITLEALSASLAQDLIHGLLEGGQAPAELVRFVRERSGGNPFFIEEILNTLRETKALVRDNGGWKLTGRLADFHVPGTVQGVIASRLDRLEPQNKRLLQEASVIGHSFFYAVLGRITSLQGELRSRLEGLESQDMLRTQALEPDLEYMFKHPLTQEVVYNSLLKPDRQSIHERVGRAIEEVLAERLPEYYERLAHHFLQGESGIKAANYLMYSGVKAVDNFNLEEAEVYFQQGYDILQRLERTPEADVHLIHLLSQWGRLAYHSGKMERFRQIALKHLDTAEGISDKKIKGYFHAWLGCAEMNTGLSEDSKTHLLQAIAIGEEIKDNLLIAYACCWMPWALNGLSEFEAGIPYGNRAVNICPRERWDRNYIIPKALGGIAQAYYFLGDVHRVREIAKPLQDFQHQNSDIRGVLLSKMAEGYTLLSEGRDHEAALAFFQMTLSKDPYYIALGKLLAGMTLLALDPQKANALLGQAVGFLFEHGDHYPGFVCRILYGVSFFGCGEFKKGMRVIQEAIQWARENNRNAVNYKIWPEFALGQIYLQFALGGEPPPLRVVLKNLGFLLRTIPVAERRAIHHLEQAIALAKALNTGSVLLQANLGLGQLHLKKKRWAKARTHLEEAIAFVTENGNTVVLEKARAALAQLEGKGK